MISRIMKYKTHVFLFLLLLTCRVYAQDVHLKLYEQQEPKTDQIDSLGYIREVFSPELLGYLPENRTGLNHAVLLIPGGAYSYIAISHEGYGSAKWLAKNGITVFILKYRLPKGDPQVTINDGIRALEVIHEQSDKLGIDKDKIGVMGFSAGGHLAAALLTGFTSKKNMVNFGILVYPVISMSYSNFQTREHLLGVKADEQKWRNIYSMDKHVSADTSPTYIVLSSDDQAVPYLNGLNFYNALLNYGVKSEIRILSEGGHGWWMRNKFIYEEEIRTSILRWIRSF
ncbi:Predicted esterase [uncultured Bacteroides sp.]|jgi:acetyl esterase/lipase|nr:Predicted esterase [uncultured Bacteroides sp.]